jgi:hypothetical protein
MFCPVSVLTTISWPFSTTDRNNFETFHIAARGICNCFQNIADPEHGSQGFLSIELGHVIGM